MSEPPAGFMRPYSLLPIVECGEALATLEGRGFSFVTPHPYVAAGADYGGADPWVLRTGVVAALIRVQTQLRAEHPGWRLRLFDAYRPNAVQAFMVAREFHIVSGGRHPEDVGEAEREALWSRVFRLWALPSGDARTPAPHSTGAAVDLTLVDGAGAEIGMGSPIDENSDRSLPDYFQERDPAAHANRELLLRLMRAQGFHRHWAEWWHFSLGDQLWAWTESAGDAARAPSARYGRADLVS